jgi:hypothetical protein
MHHAGDQIGKGKTPKINRRSCVTKVPAGYQYFDDLLIFNDCSRLLNMLSVLELPIK